MDSPSGLWTMGQGNWGCSTGAPASPSEFVSVGYRPKSFMDRGSRNTNNQSRVVSVDTFHGHDVFAAPDSASAAFTPKPR